MQANYGCGQMTLVVPLHARYPHPRRLAKEQPEQQPHGVAAVVWWAPALSTAAAAEVPVPAILARCPNSPTGWQAAQLVTPDGTPAAAAAAAVQWPLPAGRLEHGPLVAAVTAVAVWCGAAAVLMVLCHSPLGQQRCKSD